MINKIKDWLSDGYVKRKFFVYIAIFIFLCFVALALSYNVDSMLTGGKPSWSVLTQFRALKDTRVFQFFTLFLTVACMFVAYLIFAQTHLNYRGGSRRIANNITIPQAVNSSQFGSASFSNPEDLTDNLSSFTYSDVKSKNSDKNIKDAGLYLGAARKGSKPVYCATEDTHSIVIGTTGSGKTRCLMLQTICMLALAEESMIISDPKAELYLYSKELLSSLNYNIVTLDFLSFLKSNQYNFLQPIIDAINLNDIALAITRTNDLVAVLVSSDRTTEGIWVDGERSAIACSLIAVVYDNMDKPQYQTLTSVYYFLANMCKPSPTGAIPLTKYIMGVPDNHPARMLVHISEIAPPRMRGSFYTSALSTLYLFTSPDLYSMTNMTDFDIYNTSKEKTAIFIMLPDYKSTFYAVATLFLSQQYQILRDKAYEQGGRLPRRVNYVLEEFGNFTRLPDFRQQITVGRGCGVRYHLCIQDFHQLESIYGNDDAKTIRSNCETWVYLHSQDPETLNELSTRLGNFTMKSPSISANADSASTSFSLTGRELLKSDELAAIKRPYQLVFSGGDKCIMYSPDISKTPFNRLLGLGDKEYNQQLSMQRNKERTKRARITIEDIPIWEPWK